MSTLLFRYRAGFYFSAALVAFAILNPVKARAAGQVCGRAVDADMMAVTHATVTIYSRDSKFQLSTQTNDSGEYCLRELPEGEFFLQAVAAGFRLTKAQLLNVTDGAQKAADLKLQVAPAQTQITVTSNGFPQASSEISKQLSSIDVSNAEAEGRSSLVDALDQVPGLRVTQEGGPGSFAGVQIRGLRSFDTSILVDGMRLRDVSATQGDASSFLSDIWFTDTTQVEILQGAGASLYGTNAIGGVVNLLTDKGGGPFHGDINLQGGMLGQFIGKAHVAGGVGKRLFYSAGFGVVDVTEGVSEIGQYRNTGGIGSGDYIGGLGFRVGARVISAGTFGQLQDNAIPLPPQNASGGAVNAVALPVNQIPAAVASITAGLPFGFGNATFIPAYGDADYYRTVQFVSTLAYVEQQVTPKLHYRVNLQDFATNRNYVNGPGGLGYQPIDRTSTKYNSRTDTVNALGEWQPVHSQLLSGGYEFEREAYNSPAYTGQIPVFYSRTSAKQDSHAVFFQDQMKFMRDRLQLSLSGRWQTFQLESPSFSGNFPVYASAGSTQPPSAWTGDASLAYFVRSTSRNTGGTKLRAHAGNAYRAPSLYERFGTYFDGNFFSAYGDPRLSPERAISMDIGVDQYLAGDKFNVSASYFYTRLQRTIAYDPGVAINPLSDPYARAGGYYNTPGGLARGVEVSTEMKLPRAVLVRAAFTYTNSIDRLSEFSDGQLQTPVIFPETFSFAVLKSFRQHWDTSLDFLAGSKFVFPMFNSLPPYDVLAYSFQGPKKLDSTIGYTHLISEGKKLRLYVRLENIGNQKFFEGGFLTPGFVARGGVQFSF